MTPRPRRAPGLPVAGGITATAAPVAGAIAVVLALGGCGPRHVAGPGVDDDDAIVTIVTNVAGAEVWADGVHVLDLRGTRGKIAFEPGVHRVEVRADDHFAVFTELRLAARERRELRADLAERLP